MNRKELAFVNSFDKLRFVRLESGGAVTVCEGLVSVSGSDFVLIADNKIYFECEKKSLTCSSLMSGNGIIVRGLNNITGKTESFTVYFSYSGS